MWTRVNGKQLKPACVRGLPNAASAVSLCVGRAEKNVFNAVGISFSSAKNAEGFLGHRDEALMINMNN
jgi:hypothetical protein